MSDASGTDRFESGLESEMSTVLDRGRREVLAVAETKEEFVAEMQDSQPGIEDLASRLRFEFTEGNIWLGEERMVLLHMRAFGSLRKELADTLGAERARGLMTRMGYAAGICDAELVRKLCPDVPDAEIIRKGPLLHTLEGFVKVIPIRIEADIAKGTYYSEVQWANSFENEAHQKIFGVESGATGWMQQGYAVGYVSGIMRTFILFRETEIGPQGSRLVGKPLKDWAPAEAEDSLKYFHPDAIADQILELQQQVQGLRYSIEEAIETSDLVGTSPGFRRAWSLIQKAAGSQITVLLLGETGVGKEVFARGLHKASSRANGPFVAVNCAALPDALIESELFGVEKGAFTGARESRPGRFERAHWGTLFLDEVSELSPSAQSKLLRALQEGEVERLGDTKARKIDVRVVAASNVDLQDAVKNGRFRKDLYYRLNILPVHIPPLRERTEDIPLLVDRFIEKYSAREGKRISGITSRAMHMLLNHDWPGNVRELENMLERGVLLAQNGARIDISNLLLASSQSVAEVPEATLDLEGKLSPCDSDAVRKLIDYGLSKKNALDTFERLLIDAALERANGNVSMAARALGITRAQLRYRLKHKRL